MKQSADLRPVLDLDDLERQLQAAVDSKKTYSDDPLSELARIVRQDDPLRSGGKAQRESGPSLSFDDFLKSPPRSASGVMPQHTPAIEPLFPEKEMDSPVLAVADSTHTTSEIHSLSDDNQRVEPQTEPVFTTGANDDDQEKADSDRGEESGPLQDDFDRRLTEALAEDESEILHDKATAQPALASLPSFETTEPVAPKAPFDDMLAEFEAAMRDVGGQPAPQRAVPSLEPVAVPPPPSGLAPLNTDTGIARNSYGDLSSGATVLGAGAAGTTVIAVGAIASGASQAAANPRSMGAKSPFRSRGLMIAAGVVGVAVIGMGSLLGFGTGLRKAPAVNAPVIAAKPGVTKERPVNPGGVEVPNQDKEVLQAKPQTAAVERVAPREEQPVDLTAAQRRVQTSPDTASATSAVRQIQGVAIVAPISIKPPATAAVVSAEPAPRPVASVPITIAGQSSPVAPSVLAPVPIAAPVITSATTPATAAPVTAPPLRTATPANSAEPRRVRAVPIRADGEPAPARAQAQPRIVPAAPGVQPAVEPDAANAPLRITPLANRAAPQRVASAQSAQTAQETPAPRTTGGTGNFTVQLAAEGSSDSARSKFNRIRGQHSSVLGGYEPDIRTAEVNGRNVYRVRVGSFSREEAVSVCERLKASGGTCFVARN